jgi:hypothetical protein
VSFAVVTKLPNVELRIRFDPRTTVSAPWKNNVTLLPECPFGVIDVMFVVPEMETTSHAVGRVMVDADAITGSTGSLNVAESVPFQLLFLYSRKAAVEPRRNAVSVELTTVLLTIESVELKFGTTKMPYCIFAAESMITFPSIIDSGAPEAI